MAQTAQDVIDVALGEVGYLEKRSNSNLDSKTANAGSANYTKYGKWYGVNPAQWCAMFVSYCMAQAGMGGLAPKYVGCYNGIAWFKENAQFHTRSGYTPKSGDVIFFSSAQYPNGGAHTGIVVGCDGKYVYTVEGNTSGGNTLISNGGGVAKKSYLLGYAKIYGYGTPNYAVANTEMEDDEMLSYEQFKEYMNQYMDELSKQPEPDWSKKEGYWGAATQQGIVNGQNPQGFIRRCELTAVEGRMGLIKK